MTAERSLCEGAGTNDGVHHRNEPDGRRVAGRRAQGRATNPPDAPELNIQPAVAFRFVLRAGSQSDPPGKEGLAALTASMVAEGGTKTLTYDQLLEAFYPMAASLSGACRKEVTVFSGVVHQDNLQKYTSLATEMIAQPRFDPQDFERLRNEALDYVTKFLRGNNDEELGKWTLIVELYQDHPYGHPDVGTEQGLKSITLEDVKEFHRTALHATGDDPGPRGRF